MTGSGRRFSTIWRSCAGAFIVLVALASLAADRHSRAEAPSAELAALVDYMRSRGIELRAAENRSNVIGHMFSVGPAHEKQYIVGLSWYATPPDAANIGSRPAIAIPSAVNGRWILWRVGGPGGNARPDYLPVWEKTREAFAAYADKR